MVDTSSTSTLRINWSYGFSKDILNGVQSLTNRDRNALFFISSHSGVIYDYEHRTQMILQGHCNLITCCAVSHDKRWIVTGDVGDDPILVVWDSMTGAPVKTIFGPHGIGVVSVDISEDSLFVATLGAVGANGVQEIAIWAWTREEDTPILRQPVLVSDIHHTVKFDPLKQSELVSTGNKTVCFWNWGEFSLEGYAGKISKADFGHAAGRFTSTIFLPGTGNALTVTSEGSAILWETQFATVLMGAQKERLMRSASKVLRLIEGGINTVTTTFNNYLVVACHDGAVRFYDFFLRLEAWFEDLSAGPVTSISFAVQNCPFPMGEAGAPGLKFWVPDFMVGTSDAFVVGVESRLFDEVRSDDRRGTLLMQGMADHVSSVACHPTRPLAAFACYNGALQIWDYDMKLLMNLREFNSRPNATSKPGSATYRSDSRNFLRPQCVAFEPHGEFVAVGFTSGNVKFLNVDTFEDVASFAPCLDSINCLKFSPSGIYMAGFDSGNHVLLFKKSSAVDASSLGDEGEHGSEYFAYLGRAHSHGASITGLEFGFKEGIETLVSISEDRRCVEYDI